MAVPTWGMLQKSQDDDETIEEAITRLIREHNEDEEAHLGPGQSLQSHKTAEIIDHLVNSIVADKIKTGEISLDKLSTTQLQVYTCFESLDGWYKAGTGSYYPGVLAAHITTPASTNEIAKIKMETAGGGYNLDFSKNPFFQSSFYVSVSEDCLAYIIVGTCIFDGTDMNFGFKLEDGNLYAVKTETDGDEQNETAEQITGVDTSIAHIYRAQYDDVGGEIRYYVDGVLKKTFTKHTYTELRDELFTYYVKTKTDVPRMLHMNYLLFSQNI